MSENLFASESTEITDREIKHFSIVRKAAAEGIVLLENSGVLPFDSSVKSIALFGTGARRTVKGGTGSGDVNVRDFVNVEKGLLNAGYAITTGEYLDEYDSVIGKAKTDYAMMLREAGKDGIKNALFTMFAKPFKEPAIAPLTEEIIDKSKADAAVYVLSRNSGEGADRKPEKGDYYLTEREISDIKLLSEKYDRFVLLLNVGGVVDLSDIIRIKTGAVLLIGQGGSAFGDAVADILSGIETPSGKLSATWAASYSDYPFADEFADSRYISDTFYREGIFVGYRWFDKTEIKPLFQFGFGLSYTDFEIGETETDVCGETVKIKTTVKNTGSFKGKEVVQIYVSQPDGRLIKSRKMLTAFRKTGCLNPKESEEISLDFSIRTLASYDEKAEVFIIEKGKYIIFAGTDSKNIKPVSAIVFTEDAVTEKCRSITETDVEEYIDFPRKAGDSFENIPEIHIDCDSIKTIIHRYDSEGFTDKKSNNSCTFDDVINNKITAKEFVCDLTDDELVSLCVGASRVGLSDLSFIGNASKNIPGAAGDTCDELFKRRELPPLSTADGPAGVRVNPKVYEKDGMYIDNPADDPVKSLLLPAEMQKVDLNGATVKYQYCTAIPVATMLAQTWNTEIIKECGRLVGEELKLLGLDLWLAPALNIQRNPLCGRNFEYYSEDPILSGECAAAMVSGMQSVSGKGTVVKHFACNNKENNRNYNNSVLSERTLREIYLKGFEICIKKSAPFSVMSSYNLINGIHAANHKGLLTDILRNEWNFNGFVMTDWYATQGNAPVPDGYEATSPALCVKAGNDVIMPGNLNDIERTKSALESCEISVSDLRKCAERIVRTTLKAR